LAEYPLPSPGRAIGGFAPRIDDLGRGKAPVAARRHHRRAQPALADSPVQGLLADAQESRRRARADELVISIAYGHAPAQPLSVLGEEAAMASRGDKRGPKLPPRDGAKNTRPADAESIC
jgi:hypothetical protein